ncbi:Eukaryotic translation initiation factor 4 gamma [Sphaceloma murrayae]|uniref:Eukaryotic translation initiation factor 4 gamma n=1 Tax=Sphaceloma murrayae TaxID=2082308 RepID=A0A2K1QVN1_9PEZI|nr:Eukaryotic translation initiation factor 4 gamma [Sphaceloma murrayae]
MDPPPPPQRPAKPSPHRFVVKKRSSNATNTAPSRPSYVTPTAPSPSPRPTPRFAHSAHDAGSNSRSTRPGLDVQVNKQDSLDIQPEDEDADRGTTALPTIEVDHEGYHLPPQPDDNSHKRRRIEAQPKMSIEPNRPTPRFVLSQAATFSTSEPITDRTKPAFMHPVLPSDSIDPLPEFFSPHRRGQRFAPGGMAAEMTSWITDLGNSVSVAHQGRGVGDVLEGGIVLAVEHVTGEENLLFLDGRTPDGDRLSVVLTGSGDAGRGSTVKPGDKLGIREPSWDLDVQGEQEEKVRVAVDWRIMR